MACDARQATDTDQFATEFRPGRIDCHAKLRSTLDLLEKGRQMLNVLASKLRHSRRDVRAYRRALGEHLLHPLCGKLRAHYVELRRDAPFIAEIDLSGAGEIIAAQSGEFPALAALM